MEFAALASFAILLVAWLIAPDRARAVAEPPARVPARDSTEARAADRPTLAA